MRNPKGEDCIMKDVCSHKEDGFCEGSECDNYTVAEYSRSLHPVIERQLEWLWENCDISFYKPHRNNGVPIKHNRNAPWHIKAIRRNEIEKLMKDDLSAQCAGMSDNYKTNGEK